MLRPAVLLALSIELLCHKASTLGSLHQLPFSYEATWLLPRLIFHQLVVPSLARRAKTKKAATTRLLSLYVLVTRQNLMSAVYIECI
jgi:Na+/serine symporter